MSSHRSDRLRIGARVTGLALGVALLACVLVPAAALAKDYSIGSVSIGAAVDHNGDMRVTEDRTVVFHGQFSWVQWQLKKKGSDGIAIESVSSMKGGADQPFTLVQGEATQPGTYSIVDNGDSLDVRLAISETDTSLPLRITYFVKGAAKAYADTSELYWQFIGDTTSVSTGNVHIVIAPPETLTASQVKAWAHGPLTGTVAIGGDGKVTLDVPELPANTFVEARVLYPAGLLTGAPMLGGSRLQAVLDEEAKSANQANSTRAQARLVSWGSLGLAGLFSLGALGYAIWAFLRHGREYKPQFPGGYLREDPRPDLPPAVVGALWRFGKVSDADIAATLMDLADKHVIAMRPTVEHDDGVFGISAHDNKSFELGLNPDPPADAVGITDRLMLDILFTDIGDGSSVTLGQIKSYAKSDAPAFSASIKRWKDACEGVADGQNLFETNSWTWQIGMFALAAVVVAAGVFAASFAGSAVPLCMAVPSGIAIGIMGAFMLRRSKEGNELYAHYRALRDFLRDFSRLKEAPPASVAIWNRFIVLAVVFGIAEEVIRQLRVAVPDVVADPRFQTMYWWVYSGNGEMSPVASLQGGFASASQIAASEMSSASGGGGGFSGGGGGGGGGGGFSAG
jgi:uncharacterized membrane protein